jgi:uncharacterized protein involved in exopolysaccharide biosynthesis
MNEESLYLDEMIDLRRMLTTLWCYRRWIFGLTFGAAVAALVVSFLVPPTYEATALAVMTPTQYKVQFDPRIETVINPVDMQIDVYTGLATSDGVLQQVFSSMEPLPLGVENIEDLREILSVNGRNGLLTFTAKAHLPQDASRLVNSWVQIFVDEANRVYGTGDTGQLTFFKTQLEETANALQAAEEAMTEFTSQDKSVIVQNQMASLQQSQKDYLSEQRSLASASSNAMSRER